MMLMSGEGWSSLGSAIAGIMFAWVMARQYFPHQLDAYISKLTTKLVSLVYPYIQITFDEYTGERMKRSEAYAAIETYLGTNSGEQAKRLKAQIGRDSTSITLSMDDYEEVKEEFRGAKVWWSSHKIPSRATSLSLYPGPEDRRYYRLTFHPIHRELIHQVYLPYVMEEGKAIDVRKRQRKLFTNCPHRDDWYKQHAWSHVPFEHPATFNTLALEPEKKQQIIQDLITFRDSKDYYSEIGKPWKRGYLLYGPPGTGKSTMVAAMANLLDYDVYDLELTAVKDNTELRKLLIETTGKSIIVIEDVDCSLDLTGARKEKKEVEKEAANKPPLPTEKEASKVTLSGLLNFIDGLWSACGGERIIVFTTNHVEKLDQALIRRGRMDKHIKMSYCSFPVFKVLAKNYLGIDSHPLFDTIHQQIMETKITPADVAENLMCKTATRTDERIESCLQSLVQALRECKLKAEEEKEMKAKEEEEMKAKETEPKIKPNDDENKPKEEDEEKAVTTETSESKEGN